MTNPYEPPDDKEPDRLTLGALLLWVFVVGLGVGILIGLSIVRSF